LIIIISYLSDIILIIIIYLF